MSRRRFLAGGAAASAGVLLPGTAAQAAGTEAKAPVKHRGTNARKVDVVVVGAGLAGITAARWVAAQGKSVALLEARDRVGGRTLNHKLPGTAPREWSASSTWPRSSPPSISSPPRSRWLRRGPQDSRFVGGSQLISIRAAATLGKALHRNAAVRSIVQKGNQATVTSDAGVFKGKRVIVAVPPQLAAQIDYTPLMSPQLDAMRRRMTLGTLMKIHAVYEEPFWREDAGVWMGLKIGGCTPEMFDNTPPEGKPGVLMGFHGGKAWRDYAANPAARRAAALSDFAEVFGARALNPIAYFEQDWTAEEWSRGCPVSVVGPGVVTEFLPNLTAPHGLVHWAGTETATYWNGYMSGAIESGVRAAKEVLAEI